MLRAGSVENLDPHPGQMTPESDRLRETAKTAGHLSDKLDNRDKRPVSLERS